VVGHPHHQAVTGDAGARDEDLDGTLLGDHAVDRLLHRGGIGNVALDAEQVIGRITRVVRHRDAMARRSQRASDTEPDAVVATRDQD
jgi:hypothetical protein